MEEAKVNGKKVIVDVDRLIAFCTRHKQGAAPLMVNSHAIELLTSGEDFEGGGVDHSRQCDSHPSGVLPEGQDRFPHRQASTSPYLS